MSESAMRHLVLNSQEQGSNKVQPAGKVLCFQLSGWPALADTEAREKHFALAKKRDFLSGCVIMW